MNIVDLDSRRKSRVRSQAPAVLDGSIRLSTLYLPTAPSTPEASRTEVVERTEAGEAIVENARATGKPAPRGWSPDRWRRHRERKRARRHNTARPGEAEAVATSTEAPTITTNASVAMYAAKRSDNAARPDEAPTAPPNDISPANAGELACLNARISGLETENRLLESTNIGLQSEVDELKTAQHNVAELLRLLLATTKEALESRVVEHVTVADHWPRSAQAARGAQDPHRLQGAGKGTPSTPHSEEPRGFARTRSAPMTREQLVELADDLGIEPKRIAAVVALMRTGRADLVAAVMEKRLSLRAALATARESKKD